MYFYWKSPEDFTGRLASSSVLDILHLFLYKRPPPALECLDLQVAGHPVGHGAENLKKFPFAGIDDAVFRAISTRRLRAVSLGSWYCTSLSEEQWDMTFAMFPCLSKNRLLSRQRVR